MTPPSSSTSTTKKTPKASQTSQTSQTSKDPGDPINLTSPAKAHGGGKKKLGRGLGALLGEVQREEPLVQNAESLPQTDNKIGKNSANQTAAEMTNAGDNLSLNKVENDHLIDHSSDNESYPTPKGALAHIPLAEIEPLPGQPRTHFDAEALEDLAASIAERGVIQPIIVRPIDNNRYQLVAGERRWRATQRTHHHVIPAIIRDMDDHHAMALALIENLQRENLNPIEEALAYQRLAKQDMLSQAEIARFVNKSRSHIANMMRLLGLPQDVLEMVSEGELSTGHARALIGQEEASQMAQRAVKQKMSVREVERLVKKSAEPAGDTLRRARSSRDPAKDADIAAVQNHLEDLLGLSVKIKTDPDPRSGLVSIRYRSLDQLDLICQKLTGGQI